MPAMQYSLDPEHDALLRECLEVRGFAVHFTPNPLPDGKAWKFSMNTLWLSWTAHRTTEDLNRSIRECLSCLGAVGAL